jgi:FAD/FMN-containing dehydrogenase
MLHSLFAKVLSGPTLIVIWQTVVLPSGEVIKTRRRSRKSSAGFDTTKLFIGAEGTLGIVTELTIRLAPVLPTTVATARFPNVRNASEAVIEILNTGIGIRALLALLLSHFSLFFGSLVNPCPSI